MPDWLDAVQARRALVLLARVSAEQEAARALLETSLARFADVVEEMTAPREVPVAIAGGLLLHHPPLGRSSSRISNQTGAAGYAGSRPATCPITLSGCCWQALECIAVDHCFAAHGW